MSLLRRLLNAAKLPSLQATHSALPRWAPCDRYSGGATSADFAREHDVVYKNAAEAPLRTRPPRSSLLIDGQSMGGDA